jgi:RNA polymerase sigma-70 factor (ECF subfamily)
MSYYRGQTAAGFANNVYADDPDENLMEQYRDGNAEAFTTLYQRNKVALYRYFLRQTHHNSIAEELSQDVWTNIIRARRAYQANAKFTTYLFQIAHNRLVDYYRRADNRAMHHSTNTDEDCEIANGVHYHPDKQAESAQIQQRLLTLVHALPQEQREAFILKEDAGLSVEQIAMITDVNAETAKSRLRYAVKKIREGLKDFL